MEKIYVRQHPSMIDIVEAISHCRSQSRYYVLVVVKNIETIADEVKLLLESSDALVKQRAHNIEITFSNGSRCEIICSATIENSRGRRVHEAYCFTDIDERLMSDVIRPQVTLKYKAEESS